MIVNQPKSKLQEAEEISSAHFAMEAELTIYNKFGHNFHLVKKAARHKTKLILESKHFSNYYEAVGYLHKIKNKSQNS